ncbi:MAG: tryptophan--tRNA ligase [Paenibacillaceae bacterium]|nr:tryptophan--tRNA ligase [Paenibacillaceae bacterium]
MARVLSGIQPSGIMTIGNYLGALQPFVQRHATDECVFMIADLHALTVPQHPDVVRARTIDAVAMAVACGIDASRAIVFVQSHVMEHALLSWILTTMTTMGELERMTQYKDKGQGQVSVGTGLFVYPVLQAADILLYDTDIVPVGDDQRQHIELTRDIAKRCNQKYGDMFVVPQGQYVDRGTRIMSLVDGRRKMSKSDASEGAYIGLLDTPDVVRRKIGRATTDSGKDIVVDWEHKPEVSNLIELFAACTGQMSAHIVAQYEGVGYGAFKRDLAEAIVACVQPIQQTYARIRESGMVQQWMDDGAQRARSIARQTVRRVTERIGLVPGDGHLGV